LEEKNDRTMEINSATLKKDMVIVACELSYNDVSNLFGNVTQE
jgi:hypothetical protein